MSELVTGAPERLWTGAVWSEGPVWLPALGALRWSDVRTNRILQYDRATGTVAVHSSDPEYANGRTLDLAGQVVQCSHGQRRVERDVDGVVTAIADAFDGHRLNSPNDVIVASDGGVWFTDPPYGIQAGGAEGHPGDEEYGGCFVFRVDEATGEVAPMITGMTRPNGLAFSPDESVLYVANTGAGAGDGPGYADRILAFEMRDGRPADPRVFADPGTADGFRVDVEGRLWTSFSDGDHGGVAVYAPDGTELLRVPLPERTANVAFGGPDGDELYVTASTSLYRIRTATVAAPRPGPRG